MKRLVRDGESETGEQNDSQRYYVSSYYKSFIDIILNEKIMVDMECSNYEMHKNNLQLKKK